MMTYEEIKTELESINNDFKYNSLLRGMMQYNVSLSDLSDRLGKITRMERFDPAIYFENYEDSTYKLYAIYYFEDHNVYIKFSGWWSSYGGAEFEEMKQVFPITKTITVYE